MATFNMCNQFDQKTDSVTVLSGSVHTEYEDLPQPKPKDEEKKPFSAKGLFGKMLGGLAVVAVASAVVGLAAAYVASVVVTGGATLAAAPLLVTGTAFLLTSGFAAYSGSQVLDAQYKSDLAKKEDSGWGAYVGAPAMETVKTGARDVTWQMAIPVAGKYAGPVISKYAGKLFNKMFSPKVSAGGGKGGAGSSGSKGSKWIDSKGDPIWPENRGFAKPPTTQTLKPGTRIDRYGYDGGSFVSPKGTPYTNRSLAPGTEIKPYTVFEVISPVEVQAGKIAPWFGEKGGGIQYEFGQSIADLLDKGILKKVGF